MGAEYSHIPWAVPDLQLAPDVCIEVRVDFQQSTASGCCVFKGFGFFGIGIGVGKNILQCIGEDVGDCCVRIFGGVCTKVSAVAAIDTAEGFYHRGNVVDGQTRTIFRSELLYSLVCPLFSFTKAN